MNDTEIDRLLRAQAPEVPVPPGLETRVRASLRLTRRSRFPVRLAWLAAPALAVVALVIALSRPSPPPASHGAGDPTDSVPELAAAAADGPELAVNPLGDEARALRNDAEKTGRFLLDCLPSLSVAER